MKNGGGFGKIETSLQGGPKSSEEDLRRGRAKEVKLETEISIETLESWAAETYRLIDIREAAMQEYGMLPGRRRSGRRSWRKPSLGKRTKSGCYTARAGSTAGR
ncbi:MAG: hypothetical protein V8Q43_02695 [Christensenellaceae bacterium]